MIIRPDENFIFRPAGRRVAGAVALCVVCVVCVGACTAGKPAPTRLPAPATTATTRLADGSERSVTVYRQQSDRETQSATLPTTTPAPVVVATGSPPLLFRTASAARVRVSSDDDRVLFESEVAGGLFVAVSERGIFVGNTLVKPGPLAGTAYRIEVVPPTDNQTSQTRVGPRPPAQNPPPP